MALKPKQDYSFNFPNRDTGSIPGLGTKIPYVVLYGKRFKKEKQNLTKFNIDLTFEKN